jgi:bifunctional non-homologous end joining protein LigD
MAPTLVREPFHRDGWVYEEKVDGYRMLAYKDAGKVRLVSRNSVDHTHRYPDVAAAVRRLKPTTLVLDGETRSVRSAVPRALRLAAPSSPAELATPPTLIAFDVLFLRGRDLSEQPLRDRRPRLEDLLAGADHVHAVRRLAPNGLKAWEQVLAAGYEGLVAKDNALPVALRGSGSRSSKRAGQIARIGGGGP